MAEAGSTSIDQGSDMPPTMAGLQPVDIRGSGATLFLQWLPVAALFLSYPLAIVCPVTTWCSRVFYFSLPFFFWLSIASVTFFLLNPLRPYRGREVGDGSRAIPAARYGVFVLFWLAVGLVGLSAWHSGVRSSADVVTMLGCIAVPIYFATCPRAVLPPKLPQLLGLLWAVNVLHGLWQCYIGFEVVGLAGNRNWMATLVLVLAPWAWQYTNSLGWHRLHKLAAACAIAALSLFVAWQGHSRGCWLALGAYLFFFVVLPRFAWLLRLFLVTGIAGVLFVGTQMYPERVARAIGEDIRLPLWTQTVKLIRDHAGLGAGPGRFRAEFVAYKSVAQKERLVAASVTEHPHNELLNVAAEGGIPLATLWLLLALPLFLKVPHNNFWRIVHFGAWMIWTHALFDKVLVQPPTSILGYMFIGWLWRLRLPVRLRPELRSPLIGKVARPLGWAIAALAVIHGGMLTGASWYMRRGMVMEDLNQARPALAAYASAARWNSSDVYPYALAGIVANNRLNDPEQAMRFLQEAWRLEPDFAHLNGEFGVALAAKREHEKALQFFQRDAELFPFDPVALRRVLFCSLNCGRDAEVPAMAERLCRLEHRQVVLRLGAEQTMSLAGRWLRALQSRLPDEAVLAAGELLRPLDVGLGDPAFFTVVQPALKGSDIYYRDNNHEDVLYWQAMLQVQRRTGRWTLPGGAVDARGAPAKGGGPRIFLDYQGLLPGTLVEQALAMYQAGYDAGVLIDRNQEPLGIIEARQNGKVWLISPSRNRVVLGLSAAVLCHDAEVAGQFGLRLEALSGARLAIPVSPLDFCGRTQALRHILQSEYRELSPRFGEIPSVRLARYRERAGPGAPPPCFTLLLPAASLEKP